MKKKREVVLYDDAGLRLTADVDAFVDHTELTVREFVTAVCAGGNVKFDDSALQRFIVAELAACSEPWESSLVVRADALVRESRLRLLEDVFQGVLERMSRDLGEPLTATDYANARRPMIDAIEDLRKAAARSVKKRRRGGITLTEPVSEDALKRFHPTVMKVWPLWKDLLQCRRADPAGWQAAATDAGGLSKLLTPEEQRALGEVIKKIGTNQSKKINGAKIEPKSCALEHARCALHMRKRADSVLRKLEKQSRDLAADESSLT